MNNDTTAEISEKELTDIRENYEDEYWSKKYGVSAEELKKQENSKARIYHKIVEANFNNKRFNS